MSTSETDPNNTEPTVDLNLVAIGHREELCSDCDYATFGAHVRVATWHMVMTDSCACLPNPTPLCEGHKLTVDMHLDEYGPFNWSCHRCSYQADVRELRRIRHH